MTRYILREHKNKILDNMKQYWDYYNSKFARKKDDDSGKNIRDGWAGAAVLLPPRPVPPPRQAPTCGRITKEFLIGCKLLNNSIYLKDGSS